MSAEQINQLQRQVDLLVSGARQNTAKVEKLSERIEILEQQLSILLLINTEVFKTTDAFVKILPLLGEDIWKAFQAFANENGKELLQLLNHEENTGDTKPHTESSSSEESDP